MTDPTAFENMKIVLEGAVYDLDFAGTVTVKNRSEMINLASLSRQYELEMVLKEKENLNQISAAIRLKAALKNLTAELLPGISASTGDFAGCHAEIKFNLNLAIQETDAAELLGMLEELWGKDRRIVCTSRKIQDNHGLASESTEIHVFFDRLLTEEQINDLQPMASCCVHSLEALEHWANEER
ncbi:hypothetical protein D0469_08970 [Peribacillus saganii]|uniref:Uncharacterized protein n=1 Tax=Peribacillus saganii TaxID=2303992 RepID=A0A372LP76_9BACI|nr:hypothetical protein [Peribacillus saganii]RFU69693.1 hypothetical protein D0469_08970 [Peribacillus saganii]